MSAMLVSSSAPRMRAALAMRGRGHDIPPDAPAVCGPPQLALCGPGQRDAWTRPRERAEDMVATVWGTRAVVHLGLAEVAPHGQPAAIAPPSEYSRPLGAPSRRMW